MNSKIEFIKDLARIMEKYNVKLSIDVDQDYSGVRSVELYFDTPESKDNLIFTGHKRLVDFKEILQRV